MFLSIIVIYLYYIVIFLVAIYSRHVGSTVKKEVKLWIKDIQTGAQLKDSGKDSHF